MPMWLSQNELPGIGTVPQEALQIWGELTLSRFVAAWVCTKATS